MNRLIVLLGVLGVGMSLPATVSAQTQRVPRYEPATPTTSRFINLIPGGAGGVSNFYGVIRRQERQAQLALQQDRALRTQALEIERLQSPQNATGLAAPRPTGQSAWFQLAPQRGRFRDTSHYFFRWDSRRISPTR